MTEVTAQEANDIRMALHFAISDREDYAGCHGDGPEKKHALAQAKRYKKLLKKLFNDMTDDDRAKADIKSGKAKMVSMFELGDNSDQG